MLLLFSLDVQKAFWFDYALHIARLASLSFLLTHTPSHKNNSMRGNRFCSLIFWQNKLAPYKNVYKNNKIKDERGNLKSSKQQQQINRRHDICMLQYMCAYVFSFSFVGFLHKKHVWFLKFKYYIHTKRIKLKSKTNNQA